MEENNCRERIKALVKILRYFDNHQTQARIIIGSIAWLLISFGIALILQASRSCFGDILKNFINFLL